MQVAPEIDERVSVAIQLLSWAETQAAEQPTQLQQQGEQ